MLHLSINNKRITTSAAKLAEKLPVLFYAPIGLAKPIKIPHKRHLVRNVKAIVKAVDALSTAELNNLDRLEYLNTVINQYYAFYTQTVNNLATKENLRITATNFSKGINYNSFVKYQRQMAKALAEYMQKLATENVEKSTEETTEETETVEPVNTSNNE